MTATTSFSYDPFAPAVMANPLPFYERLRRDHPVYYMPQYDAFVLSRFGDVMEMMRHIDNSFVQSEGSLPTPAALRAINHGAPLPPADDPLPISQRFGLPIHGEVRRAHIKPLMPSQLAALRERVRQVAHQRLDLLLPKKRFNLTRDYGGFISSSTVMHLMGMPPELTEQCLDIVNGGTATDPEFGGFDTAATAAKAIDFYLPYVEKRFAVGADGSVPMVDGMIHYRYKGRALTPREVAVQLVCAFIGGIESVPKVTAHGLMELSRHPDQLNDVRADLDTNVPRAVEEMLRLCAPAQWFIRTCHKPITIAGQRIEPGQRVFAMLASADRDEREFEDPNSFQWNREIRRTLAFGYGMHVCIGAHLARMEVREAVRVFLERVPKFHFDMDAAVRPASSFQWSWNVLPVVID